MNQVTRRNPDDAFLPRNDGGATVPAPSQGPEQARNVGRPEPRDSLVDILERVLDKGVVIAGDIRINLLDIELLTIKIRLLISSVDKAKEMGIDWWTRDPQLSGNANGGGKAMGGDAPSRDLPRKDD